MNISRAFYAAGGLAVRRPWLIIGVWAVLLAGGGVLAPRLDEVFEREFVQGNVGEGQQAADLIAERFSGRSAFQELLVFTADGLTVDDDAYRQAAAAVLDRVAATGFVTEMEGYFSTGNEAAVSPDRRSTYVIINLRSQNHGDAMNASADIIDEVAATQRPLWLEAYVTGPEAVHADVTSASQSSLVRAEVVGIPVALAVLIAVFGALVASVLPLLVGVVAIVVALGVAFLVGQFVSLSVFVENVATMVGLGVGIDYSLFLVTRYRAERAARRERGDAVIETVAHAGKAVAFSGMTVIIGLTALLATEEPTIVSIGIGGVLVVAVAVAAAITLLPAVLILLGDRIEAPRALSRLVRRVHRGGSWARWARAVMRRPWLFAVAGAAVVVLLAWPAFGLRTGPIGVRMLSESAQSRRGFETIASEFGAGVASPLQVVVASDRGMAEPRVLAGIDRLTRAIEADPNFNGALSVSPLLRTLPARDQAKVAAGGIAAVPPEYRGVLAEFVNIDRGADTTVIVAYPRLDAAGGADAAVDALRKEIIPAIGELAGTTALVGGSGAIQVDSTRAVYARFPLVVALILSATFVLLMVLFRSLVIPLKAVIMNLFSVFAAYGLLVVVFQRGTGDGLLGFEAIGAVNWLTPVLLFAMLFGLSMDYEVFLMSRMRELHDEGLSNEDSVAIGLERTGGVITGAAAIMIVVFAAFMLSSVLIIKELGFALAVAVAVDATIIRVILVPASMRLFGDSNWWLPGWLARLLPEVTLERAIPSPRLGPTTRRAGRA